jgi:hypothetical protein
MRPTVRPAVPPPSREQLDVLGRLAKAGDDYGAVVAQWPHQAVFKALRRRGLIDDRYRPTMDGLLLIGASEERLGAQDIAAALADDAAWRIERTRRPDD